MTLLSLISHFSDKDGKNVLFRLHLSPLKDPKMSKKPIAPYPKIFLGVITIFMPIYDLLENFKLFQP